MHKDISESSLDNNPMSFSFNPHRAKKTSFGNNVTHIGLNNLTRQDTETHSEKTSARNFRIKKAASEIKYGQLSNLIIPQDSEREASVIGDTPQKRIKINISNADKRYENLKKRIFQETKNKKILEKKAIRILNEYKEMQFEISQSMIILGIIPPEIHFSNKIFSSGIPIDFFLGSIDTFPEGVTHKINELLNRKVVLDLTQDLHHSNNKKTIISFLGEDRAQTLLDQLSSAIKNKELTAQLQLKILILWEFKEAVYQSIYIQKNHSVLSEIKKILGDIKNKTLLVDSIAQLVETRYLFSQLRLEVRKVARDLIEQSKEVPVASYKLFKKRVYKNIRKDRVSYQDWIRAIRWTTVLDSNDIPLIEPFQDKIEELEEATERRINDWVKNIMMKISTGLFSDEQFLFDFFEILQDTIKKISPEGYLEGFSLQAHEVLFKKLTESDKNTTKQILVELEKGLKQKKPNCNWSAKIIIEYVLYFYRAPLQQLVWGATGALRHVFNAIFTKNENLMNLSDHWKEDKAQQIIIKFTPTEIQFTFLKRGSIVNEKAFWLQHLQILIPYPGGKELKNPVQANFYYKYADEDKQDMVVKNFIKKLSFVVQAWGFPVLLRDKTKETNIKTLIKDSVARLKFPFADCVHPNRAMVQQHTIQWLKNFPILPDAQFSKLEESQFGFFIANAHPEAHLETVYIIANWGSILFIYDDSNEQKKLPKDVKKTHKMLLSILKGTLTDSSENIPPLMYAVFDLRTKINELLETLDVNKDWNMRFIQDIKNYCTATHWESENRFDCMVPSLQEYFEKRPQTSGTLMMFDFIELAKNINIPKEVFESQFFSSLRLIAANLVNWENDIHSAEKEIISEDDVHNVIAILHHQFDLSYPEAFHRAVELYNHGVKKFAEYKNNIPQDLGVHRDHVKKYIEGLVEWISGHHFWAVESTRYHTSFLTPDTKRLFSKDAKKMNISTLTYVGIQHLIESYVKDVETIYDLRNSRSFNKISHHIIMTYQGWIGAISKNVSYAKIKLFEKLEMTLKNEEEICEQLTEQLFATIIQEIDLSLSVNEHPLPWALIGLLKQINQKIRSVFYIENDRISKKITSSFLLFKLLQPRIFKDIALRFSHIDLYMLDRIFNIMYRYYMDNEMPKELDLYGA